MTSIPHGDRPASNPSGSRSPVLSTNGMVATSQPLAAAAALRALQDGGNAVDAAITAAAVLNVVEPMSTGIGGDMFALVFMQKDGRPVALNGSGWSGSKATPGFFRDRHLVEIPSTGMHSVSVPGAVAGWFKLHQRYGRLPMARLLAPAIEYAESGFPVSDIISAQWQRSGTKLGPTRQAPRHGELIKMPELARSLRLIAEKGRSVFYDGEIAKKIVEFSETQDGMLSLADFNDFDAQWFEPISTKYRGFDVYEIGPQSQGITALELLNIVEGYELAGLRHNSSEYLHLLIEAKKLAFADRDRYLADPDRASVPVARLISKAYAAQRRKLIDPEKAMSGAKPGIPENGDTVYISVVDKERNAVSFINSLFESFGSGLIAGDTGIILHNRGALFELDPDHPNCVAPRKRPFHTLIPGMVLQDGQPYFCFGVMGGDMQPQGHLQVLANLIDFGMDVQQAGEAPRFRHSGNEVLLESGFDPRVVDELRHKGHQIGAAIDVWGGYQGIVIESGGRVLMGGSDPRKDGLAIGW